MSTPTHYIINTDLIKRLEAKSDVTVPSLADRDAIQTWRRKWAMVVGVYNDGINNGFYSLEYNKSSTSLIDNGNWEKFEQLHDLTDSAYHSPAIVANRNKAIRTNPTTGAPEYIVIENPLVGGANNLVYADAIKQAFDSLQLGLKPKDPVTAATTANITLSGEQTIDNIAIVSGNRVLVKNQTAPAENGIYVAAVGAWARASDADTWDKLISAYVLVESGLQYDSYGFYCVIEAGGVLGTDPIHWVLFSKPGDLSITNVGTGAAVFKDKVGNAVTFRTIKSNNGLLTVTQNTDEVTLDIDLSSFATETYVDDRTKLFTFNNTTDWTDVSGGHQIDFVHGLASKVSSEIMRGTDKLLVDTKEINNNTLRIYVPYGYRFTGSIKINK